MKVHLETRRLTLSARSPVHVGTRVRQLSPMEAVPFGGRIHVVHEDRFATFLAQHRLLDEFMLTVSREGDRFDLGAFLERKRLLNAPALTAFTAYSAASPPGIPTGQQATFRPLIRTGLGTPYVPGSSVKGAMRGALLNRRIAAMDEAGRSRISHQVDEQIQRGAKREHFAAPVVASLLEGQLPLGRRSPRGVSGPNLDYLRCLKVSDAHYSGDTAVYPVQILSLQRGDEGFYLKDQVLLECIPPGAEIPLSVTLDHGLLSEFRSGGGGVPFSDLDDLLSQVEAQAGQVLDEERYFFKGLRDADQLLDFYDTTDSNLRIGLGSGLPATTILLNLSMEQRFRLRNDVFRMHRDSQLFPKSRKVVTRGREPVMPLGWMRWEAAR